jgi:hypothetical protein
MERTLRVFRTPEEAERETREAYAKMTPDERVALTVELQRRYYSSNDAPRRLPRVLTITRST